jgi:O-antigen/teichoic acid export membrane protein
MGEGKTDYRDIGKSFWDFFTVFGGRAIALPLAFLATVLAARILGNEGYGTLSLFLLVSQLFFLFGINWTSAAVIRYGKEEFVINGKINRTFWSRNALLIPSLVLALILVWLFRERILSYLSMQPKSILLLALFLISLTISDYVQSILQATSQLRFYSAVKVMQFLFIVVFLGMLSLFPGDGDALLKVIWSYVISTLLASCIPLLRIQCRLLLPMAVDHNNVKRIFIFSYPVVFGSLSAYVVNWIDLIVIKRYSTIADVGIYSLAYQGMTALQQISMIISVVGTPMMVALLVTGRKDLILRYVERIVPQGLLMWNILVCLVTLCALYLIPKIFGIDFAASTTPFALLMVGMGWNMLNTFYSPVMTSYELIKQSMGIGVVIALLNLGGDLILVPGLGICGASVATSFSFIIGAALSQWLIRSFLKRKCWKELVLPLPSLLVIFLFLVISQFLIRLAFIIALVLFSWAYAKASCLFQKEDMEMLESIEMPIWLRSWMRRIYVLLGSEQ